jgi:hypothetical protein
MAFQRAPLEDFDSEPESVPAPRGAHLRLVHSVNEIAGDRATEAADEVRDAAARGIMWGLVIALVGFWAPVIALTARLLSR